jgi:predicted RNA-binding protein with TRAM domain
LREAAARNVGAAHGELQAVEVPGMTPHAQSGRLTLAGRRPDGSAVVEHFAVFTRGARVYQAMVVGDRPDAEAVAVFFSALKLGV